MAISKYAKYVLGCLILLIILIAVYRGCQVATLRDEYNTLKGQYDVLKKQADQALKEALAYIKTQDARIAEQNQIITAKDKTIAEKYQTIAGLQSSITVLEADYATLTDKDAKIANLTAQVLQWRNKCLSFESVIADKDSQLGAWKLKFDAQVGIGETWKAQYEAEHALRLVADQALVVQEKRVRSLSFGTNLKSVAIVGAAIYIGVNLLKGK